MRIERVDDTTVKLFITYSDIEEKLLYRERRNKKNVWYRFMWDDYIRVLFPKTPCF